MKYLMLVLVMVVTSVSADLVDLKYWEDENPWNGSDGTWHGIEFSYSDFDSNYVGMEILELAIGFTNVEDDDSVIVFVVNASSLPPHCPLADLYNHPDVVAGFTITPPNGDSMDNYMLPDSTIVDDSYGQFWILIYTDKAEDNGAQLCIDPGEPVPSSHTYKGSGISTPPWWTGIGLIINEAHVTVTGFIWTTSLEPLTWGSLKTSF